MIFWPYVLLRSVFSIVFGLMLALPLAAQTDVNRVVKDVERRYNSMQGLKATFVQVYRTDERAPARQETGTLYLKKPGKMRWEYERPEVKLFVVDGKRVFFYVPEDRQVTRMPVKESADLRTPLRFLLGRMNLKREFRIEAATDVAPLDPGNPVLQLTPKRKDERFTELILEVDPWNRIRRLRITETDGTITEFRLSGEIPNPRLDNAMFKFEPPPGVEVVEGAQ